jgi:hypothetical protein
VSAVDFRDVVLYDIQKLFGGNVFVVQATDQAVNVCSVCADVSDFQTTGLTVVSDGPEPIDRYSLETTD